MKPEVNDVDWLMIYEPPVFLELSEKWGESGGEREGGRDIIV